MRSFVTGLDGHVMWTRTGHVWGYWRLEAPDYEHRTTAWKAEVRHMHQLLLRSLHGEAVIHSVTTTLDPADAVARMAHGVDLARNPQWAAECEATLDLVSAAEPTQRTHWLGVPLVASSVRDQLERSAAAARDWLWDLLGVPRRTPGDIEAWHAAADSVEQVIPAVFHPRPATPAEIVWLHRHAQERGLAADRSLDYGDGLGRAVSMSDLLHGDRSGALPVAVLDEGGHTDTRGRLVNPWKRRFVKVVSADAGEEPTASYQAMLVLRGTPDDEVAFPGSEFLGRVDEAGTGADWTLRLLLRPGHAAARRNRRAVVNLNDQYRQRENEAAVGMRDLDLAAQSVEALSTRLTSDDQEVEVRATVVFAVAAAESGEAMRRARALSSFYGSGGYRLEQPIGEQAALWQAMLPGAPTTGRVRQWEQVSTSHDLSASVFLANEHLGDTRGSLLGYNTSPGPEVPPCGVILHDILGAAERDISGSVGVVGELGAGKSVALKKLAGDVVARGGRVVAIDRTAVGEYRTWAQSLTEVEVVELVAATTSLDPLRILPPHEASRVLFSFVTPLLDIPPTSSWGLVLNDVLNQEYLVAHEISSTGDLVRHLRGDCTLTGAADLARALDVYGAQDIGRVIFDGDLPPLDNTAPAIVVRTNELALPTELELTNEHLYQQMRLEKRFGRAFYALVTALARRFAFDRADELTVLLVDEAHHVTSSPEAEAEITTFVRDGRKHSAAVLLGSHDPMADFGSETLRGLIPTRILMRHRDEALARRGLTWLDMDATDDDLVKAVRFDTSPVGPEGVPPHRRGEAFLRDSSGRIGRVRISLPAIAARAEAVLTTPTGLTSSHVTAPRRDRFARTARP